MPRERESEREVGECVQAREDENGKDDRTKADKGRRIEAWIARIL